MFNEFIIFKSIFFIIFVLLIFLKIANYFKNENSPIISTHAKLIKKHISIHNHAGSDGITNQSKTFILQFQLDTGSEIKFIVKNSTFKNTPEFEWSVLTFQGDRFINFEPQNIILNK